MVFVLLSSVFIISLLLGKYLFKKWFNHLSVYAFIWYFLLTFYELKLLPYYNLSLKTWFIIIGAYVAFVLGILTYFAAKNAVAYKNKYSNIRGTHIKDSPLFYNNAKILKYVIIVTALIGLSGAIYHWMALIDMFGSIQNIIIMANIVYKMRVEGMIETIPYLETFSFISVFFAGLYTAYKGKMTIVIIIPFLAVILKDLANIGRAGMLFGLVEFISVVAICRYSFVREKKKKAKSKKSLIISFVFLFAILIAAASTVRSVKGAIEDIPGASKQLRMREDALIITPSIYLYFSAHVGVLNKYLELDKENPLFGENTFMPLYRFLHKFDVVRAPQFYQKGYYVPMWTNTGTYLRELHSDFGITGVLVVPFLLGLLATFFWFRFFHYYDFIYLICLVYIYIIIFFSFLMYAVRLGNWLISFVVLLILIPLLEKLFAIRNKKTLPLANE